MAGKVKGRDMDAPKRHVTWNGERYEMAYNNRAARIVEDIYADEYGHPEIGYYDVLNELSVPKHRAVMAMAFAAIVAGGAKVSFADFEAGFRITDIEGMRDALQAAVIESLPDVEDETKNADAAPTEETP